MKTKSAIRESLLIATLLIGMSIAAGNAAAQGQATTLPPGEMVLQDNATSAVEALTFSPDGRFLLVGDFAGNLMLWDSATWKKVRTKRVARHAVYSVGFAPDGKQIAFAASNAAGVLDSVTWSPAFQLDPQPCAPIAFSPAGRHIAVGIYEEMRLKTFDFLRNDSMATIWDTTTGRRIASLPGDPRHLGSLAFSREGTLLVTNSGSKERRLLLWDAQSGRRLWKSPEIGNRIYHLTFTPDGKRILALQDESEIVQFDVKTGKPTGDVLTVSGESSVVSVAYSADCKSIATGTRAGSLVVWNATSGQEVLSISNRNHQVTAIAFDNDGKKIAAAWSDGQIIVLDAVRGEKLRVMTPEHVPCLSSVTISGDGETVNVGRYRDSCPGVLWHLSSGAIQQRLQGEVKGIISSAFAPSGKTLASGVNDSNQTILWNLDTGKPSSVLSGHAHRVSSLAFDPQERFLATGAPDDSAIVWDLATGRKIRSFSPVAEPVYAVAVSPDGELLAVGQAEGEISVWKPLTGGKVFALKGHTKDVRGVVFTPDNRTLITAGEDHVAKFWDTKTGRQLALSAGHDSSIKSLALSRDGRILALGGTDGNASLWDIASGKRLHVLKGHDDTINSIAFSADGRIILTASNDGLLGVWSTATGKRLASWIAFNEGKDWLLFTPTGLFDSSPGGLKFVGLRIGNALSLLSDAETAKYHRPGLMKMLLEENTRSDGQ